MSFCQDGVFLAVILGGLGERLDSSYLRYLGATLALLVAWEGFLKSLVLGWVLLPVALFQGYRARKRTVPESLSREAMLQVGARALIETLDEDASNREQLQEIIDKLDEYNDNFYA